jgi:hypothetical protein
MPTVLTQLHQQTNTTHELIVNRNDQGLATMSYYENGVLQFSATRAGWDDAIPWSSGTYYAEESTRFSNPMWEFTSKVPGREAIQLHVAQSAASGNPISYSSFGCLVADSTFLNRISDAITDDKPLKITVNNDYPVSLTCDVDTSSSIDEGDRIAINVRLNANGNGVSKDCWVKIELAPGSTASTSDYRLVTDSGGAAGNLRFMHAVTNNASGGTFEDGWYVKIPAGRQSAQIVLQALNDGITEGPETANFVIGDYAFNSPKANSTAERLYSDYKQAPKALIANGGNSSAHITINDASLLDDNAFHISGGNFTQVKVARVVPGHTYEFDFQAYSIPDSLVVYDTTGTYINLSSVSGDHRGTITVSPNSNGFLTFKVIGNPDSGTAWDLGAGAPGSVPQQSFASPLNVEIRADSSLPEAAAAPPSALAPGTDVTFTLASASTPQLFTAALLSGHTYSLTAIAPDGSTIDPKITITGDNGVSSSSLDTLTSRNASLWFQADHNETIGVSVGTENALAGDIRLVFREISAAEQNVFVLATSTKLLQEDSSSESEGLSFVAYRLGDTTNAATVNWRLVPDGDHPVSAADFGGVLPSGTLTFGPGRTSQSVQINAIEDGILEGPEGFKIELFNASGAGLADVAVTGQYAALKGAVFDGFDAAVIDGGTAFDDDLIGGPLADRLSGGAGRDTLTGGAGADLFVYHRGFEADAIMDFSAAGGDRVLIQGFAQAHNFAQLLALGVQNGADAVFNFGNGDTLTLRGVNLSSLTSANFIFGGGLSGDFNGDGKSDILWRADTGHLSDWLGTASGALVGNDANAFTLVATSWHVAGTGDFNGDGRSDLVWRADSGHLSNWLGTATGGFANNDVNAASWAPTSWHIAGTGDFNGDGKSDLLWRADSGHLSNWLGTASGGLANNDANAATWAPTNWSVVGTGDFNGDGFDDILWRADTGHLSDWLGTASGHFVNNDANAATWAPTNWHVAATGDFNGDGLDDILWRADSGHLSNWLGTPSGRFVNNDANAATWAPTSWHIAATGDFNGDGKDDIFWRADTGHLSDWLATASGAFVNNDANAAFWVPTFWHVQDASVHDTLV